MLSLPRVARTLARFPSRCWTGLGKLAASRWKAGAFKVGAVISFHSTGDRGVSRDGLRGSL
jgi:hypothetical protein